MRPGHNQPDIKPSTGAGLPWIPERPGKGKGWPVKAAPDLWLNRDRYHAAAACRAEASKQTLHLRLGDRFVPGAQGPKLKPVNRRADGLASVCGGWAGELLALTMPNQHDAAHEQQCQAARFRNCRHLKVTYDGGKVARRHLEVQ